MFGGDVCNDRSDCDAAVKAYLAGTLTPDAEPTCGCSHDNCECHHE